MFKILKITLLTIILNKKNFLFKKFFLFKIIVNNVNKYKLCLECHNYNKNNKYIYKNITINIPIIKYQNKNYIKKCILDYKKIYRRSIYMNIISNYIKNFNYWKIFL